MDYAALRQVADSLTKEFTAKELRSVAHNAADVPNVECGSW